MAPLDGNSSTISSLVSSPNGQPQHAVEGSKHAVHAGKNGASRNPRRPSFETHITRTISDVSEELSRSSINSDMNLYLIMNSEVEKAHCDCCGMSEECTPSYIKRVRDLFCGRWVCGLCTEAVHEERRRMGRGVSMEDALRSHMAVCVKFNKVARSNPALYLADAMRDILKKSSQANGFRSNPNSPRDRVNKKLSISRSTSCIPAIVRE